jgi:hypothetical protein
VSVAYLFFAPHSGRLSSCSRPLRLEEAAPQIASLRAFVAGELPDLSVPKLAREKD